MNLSAIPYKSFAGRALRFPLGLIPDGTKMPILQGPLQGRKWIVGSGIHGCWLGTYELSKQKLFTATVKPGDVVWDIGANVGFYSLLSSVLVGSEGHVFSFEPVPRNLVLLRKHLELNAITNCKVLDVAVSDADGTATFDLGTNSSTGGLTAASNLRGVTRITVQTAKLDDMVASGDILPPNLVKCDIEGGEYNSLKGCVQTLAVHHPTIFLATHGADVHARCCGLLKELGYELRSLDATSLEATDELIAIYPKGGPSCRMGAPVAGRPPADSHPGRNR